MKINNIRTRYAPSPTGYFHIGGARTALFSYLFAKKQNGSFILRIEDTDIERNVHDGIDSQLKNLIKLNIMPDESFQKPISKYAPYIQSQKLDKYKKIANDLVEQKKAYRCFCKKDHLANEEEANIGTYKYSKKCLFLSEKEIQKNLSEKKEFVIRIDIQPNQSIS